MRYDSRCRTLRFFLLLLRRRRRIVTSAIAVSASFVDFVKLIGSELWLLREIDIQLKDNTQRLSVTIKLIIDNRPQVSIKLDQTCST